MVTLPCNTTPARLTSTKVATDACNARRRGITRRGNSKFSSQNANVNGVSPVAGSDNRSGLIPARVPTSTRNDGDE